MVLVPITLTASKTISSPGQSVKTFSQIKIAGFNFPPPGNRIILNLQYGDTVDGKWVSKEPYFNRTIADVHEVSGPEFNPATQEVEEVVTQEADLEFTNMVVASALVGINVDGLLLFNVVGDYLYQHLLNETPGDADYQGTIV